MQHLVTVNTFTLTPNHRLQTLVTLNTTTLTLTTVEHAVCEDGRVFRDSPVTVPNAMFSAESNI